MSDTAEDLLFDLTLTDVDRLRGLPVQGTLDPDAVSLRLHVDVDALFEHVTWGSPRLGDNAPWSLDHDRRRDQLTHGARSVAPYRVEVGR